MNQCLSYEPDHAWPASLSCQFHQTSAGKTALAEISHTGPLRVQKLFHDRDLAHCYVLHPPGGMVSGDDLDCRFRLHPRAKVLITTPASGKLYRSRKNGSMQTTRTVIEVDAEATCAYLPQDTIVFDGANGDLETQILIDASATYFGWEHAVFGRMAGSLPFSSGRLSLRLIVYRDHRLLYRDHLRIDPETLASASGLDGMTSLASGLLVLRQGSEETDAVVTSCRQVLGDFPGKSGVTAIRDGLISVRLLSARAEDTRNALELLWSSVGEQIMARTVETPRIWRT
ncbi:MAG: urease accessory protein UreD [Gammaproteobacteria bacterium]|jgi:urease accessory protein|nr:urease accessory protein UreD [Gammaproteobacteria bacterium]NCX49786.1 urease accessory protein UreD [Gammaproteobacteria bacterium]